MDRCDLPCTNGRLLCICYGSLDVLEGIMGLVVTGDFATFLPVFLVNKDFQ